MSCMEHSCLKCGWMEFNNSHGPSSCPKCGGDMAHEWDEANDNREDLFSERATRIRESDED